MRRTTIIALVLSLCALTAPRAAARRARSLRSGGAFDGISRPHRRRPARKARRHRRRVSAVKIFSTPVPPVPVAVTEIDTEGLQKLLRRGDDPSTAKPLLVNFWATWCDPCRDEFPDLVKIDADYKTRGIDIALVSGDDISEIKTGVPKFLRQMRAGMPAYLLNVPDMGRAINSVDMTWGGDLPATFVYDREGKIVFKHFGRIDPKEVRAALDRALGGK
jgi:thiol-disulfide isomerase/thioredoxin